MPFRTGSVSFARFAVTGDAPRGVDDAFLAALNANVVTPPSIGAPPETQAGWCAGQHVFDATFDAETIAFGPAALFGLRLDTNRVPADIKRAYRALAESAQSKSKDNPAAFLNRGEKQAARDEAEDRCHRELADGRHRRSKMIPILWDFDRQLIFAPAFGDAQVAALTELFHATFDSSLRPLSSGGLAYDLLSGRGMTRDYEDATPSPFTPPPPAASDEEGRGLRTPATPWCRTGPEPNDFLGNEFLIWLWWMCDTQGGLITPGNSEAGSIEHTHDTIAIVIDRVLDLECAWDATGTAALRADGPTKLPEAQDALRFGKWPRKAGLTLAADGEHWQVVFQADRFLLTGVKIPKPEEGEAATPREIVERRIRSVLTLDAAMVRLYDTFLRDRVGSSWAGIRGRIGGWAQGDASAARSTSVSTFNVDVPLSVVVAPENEPAKV